MQDPPTLRMKKAIDHTFLKFKRKDRDGEGVRGSIFSDSAPELLDSHFSDLHDGSGIGPEVILERGYKTVMGKAELVSLGFSRAQQRTPGILVPLWTVDGKQEGYQYRPDYPRFSQKGRPIKYENPTGSSVRLDCPPRCQKILGDPGTPLWITEGSKKADALASRNACAISLTGVWGFKGKNELGGVVLLADWDRIALKGRTVYLAFDSDVATKAPVKHALERLNEHLRRRGAKVWIVNLPQEGDTKTGIDDYLLKRSLEDAVNLAVEAAADGQDLERELPVPGFVLADGTVGEMVIGGDAERAFVVAVNGSVRKAPSYQANGVTYMPTKDPLAGQVVHFAATASPYDSQLSLFNQTRAFIHRYVELPADFEDMATLYVLVTWVYEFAPSIPYLRVIGDWGSGKTRFLQVVGSVCFRPIFASGATTPSPIFRILDKFQGTLVLDEADFKDSSAWVEMVKILNNGYRPGFPVLRAEKEDGKWYPHGYQVFGPKLIATRSQFRDEALESRCLTTEMMPLTRQEIPRVLPPSFEEEVNHLRSQLLTFRLANLLKLKGRTFGNELLEPDLQPRLQEILIPLKVMLNGDASMVHSLATFIHRLQERLFVRRRESAAGRVLAAIIELHQEGEELSAKSIAERVSELDDEAPELTVQKVGRLTARLGFDKRKDPSSRRALIRWDEERVARLISVYGLNNLATLSQQKTFECFETFAPDSEPASKVSPKDSTTSTETSDKTFALKPTFEPKDTKVSKVSSEDIKPDVEQSLGMTVEQALAVWSKAGKPVVHLGPSENCLDMERLLRNSEVNPRHLPVIRDWLRKWTG
jgi:hypothetical protein